VEFWVPDARAEEVIVRVAGAMTSDKGTDLVWAGLPASATTTVRLAVTGAVGVPEMIPVDAARLSPAGRLPALIDQLYGDVPPFACSTVEYCEPTVPEGRLEVVIESDTGAMTIDRVTDLVCAGLSESATEAVKLAVPLAVGVPVIKPVDVFRLSPAGILPETKDQE
jgi:hypothetical protein